MRKFETFKEISVSGISAEALIQQLVDANVQFNKYAHILFENHGFIPPNRNEKFKLVKLSLSDLGLQSPCSLQTIISRASDFGLAPCPLFTAAYLRLEYTLQPEGPYLTVVSSEPSQNENYPTGFYIRKTENILWLRGYHATGEVDWPANNEFIFLK